MSSKISASRPEKTPETPRPVAKVAAQDLEGTHAGRSASYPNKYATHRGNCGSTATRPAAERPPYPACHHTDPQAGGRSSRHGCADGLLSHDFERQRRL